MHKHIISISALLLLTGCSDMFIVADNSNNDMLTDSERCRAAVSEQLSREQTSLHMASDAQKSAYEQRYRFCMGEKGYTTSDVKP